MEFDVSPGQGLHDSHLHSRSWLGTNIELHLGTRVDVALDLYLHAIIVFPILCVKKLVKVLFSLVVPML